MKLFIALFLMVLVTVASQAQYRNDSTTYVIKIQKYHDMRTVGTLLTIAGSGMFVAGLVTMADNLLGDDQKFENGLVVYVLGAASLGAGIPLWIVGAHNHKKYSEKLRALTLNFNAGASYRGLTLRYRF
ncbi:hypothetical protein SAMN04488109_0690 [Chryseolinea serpens]|uniref:DUF4134 domain-containing protein n=1 Tax=Chryseolinea serpens TaxID=947013 RepID=A0A1M5KJU4_9BACT|nr:hypothetical protein [Chryseolinea serpens]SHG53102.1 hypothetical protein SAMN04488109_0690 [Chryseolinea serpens]